MNRSLLVMLAVALAALLLATGAAASERTPEAGPPDGAIQILENPAFTDTVVPWHIYGDAYRVPSPVYGDGTSSLCMSGTDTWALAMQEVDLLEAGCAGEGSLWLHVASSWIVPPPLVDPGFDVFEGWLSTRDGVTAINVWQRFEWEYEFDASWQDPWVRVDGVYEALGDETVIQVWLGASTNETPSYLYIGLAELWCEAAEPAWWRVLLPLVMSGEED